MPTTPSLTRVGPEVGGQHPQEPGPPLIRQGVVGVGDRRDLGPLGGGVLAFEQVGDHFADALRVSVVEIGGHIQRDPGPAAAGSTAEAIEETTGRHHATIVHPPCAMH